MQDNNVVATVNNLSDFSKQNRRPVLGNWSSVDLMKKDSGSYQDVSSDLETDSSGQERRSYSTAITPSESGRQQNQAIPSADSDA